MNVYKWLYRNWLSKWDAETVHDRTLFALEGAQSTGLGRAILHKIRGDVTADPVQAFGLTFPNVVGMAAGFDKNARVPVGLACLGFGHIEVGTLTPRPQVGNPRPRIFRYPDDGALINRMGFPNGGVDRALPPLRRLKREHAYFVLGISLGKQKETPLDDAADDYVTVMQKVYRFADYLAVNVSSPNTPGLRKLQGRDYLEGMLGRLDAERDSLKEKAHQRKPMLVKIAPDLTWDEIDVIVGAAEANNIDGIIATNTTIDHTKEETGGYSGRPLRQRSNDVIRHIAKTSQLPIIGVGGISSAVDVRAKLDAGATLVQLYTGLVYEGPGMIGTMLRDLAE